METLPLLSLPRHLPREEWGMSEGGQIYELSGGVGLFCCVLVWGPGVHTSLFVLLERPNTPARGPPDSYQRPPCLH